jgi:hypothetical protein
MPAHDNSNKATVALVVGAITVGGAALAGLGGYLVVRSARGERGSGAWGVIGGVVLVPVGLWVGVTGGVCGKWIYRDLTR